MNLYARFTAVVLSDRDYAKELNETAKDNEYIKNKAGGGDGDDKSEKSVNSIDQKSVGSSAASDKSKVALMLKKKREVMEERLDTPIRAFVRNANTFTLFFFLLMAASATLSYTQIYVTNNGKPDIFSSIRLITRKCSPLENTRRCSLVPLCNVSVCTFVA
jgi:hypothetical protein